MPFLGWDSFDDCYNEMRNQGLSEESAKKMCGFLQARAETATKEAAQEMIELMVKEIEDGPSLSGTIVTKRAAQRIVVGPVLVPGEMDSDGEKLTAEKIEQVAYDFMEHFRHVDISHTLKQVGTPVSSDLLRFEEKYVVDGEEMVLPKGTWMLGVKVADDTWPKVEDGTLKGFSVMGARRKDVEAFMATKGTQPIGMHFDGTKYRKTLLEDLGPDWVGVAVSILPNPSVFKSKFIAVKEEGGSFWKTLLQWVSLKGKKKEEQTMPLTDEEKKELQEEFKAVASEAVKEATPEIVTAVKEAMAKDDPPPPADPPADPPKEDEEITALKSELAETKEKYEEGLAKIDDFTKKLSASNALKDDGNGDKPTERPVPEIYRDAVGRRIY